MRAAGKQSLYFLVLFVLVMLLYFTGCEQKEQILEESPVFTDELLIEETPLPVEMMDNQLFYAEGMESISVNEAELMEGKEAEMIVRVADIGKLGGKIGREETNPQMKLIIVPLEKKGIDICRGRQAGNFCMFCISV